MTRLPASLRTIDGAGRTRWVLALVGLFVVGLSGLGCDSRFSPSRPVPFQSGPPTIGQGGVGVSSQLMIETPLFSGLGGLVAGDTVLHLSWTAASDDATDPSLLRYRVYVATQSGDQDFLLPTLETAPGETRATLDGLTNGTALFVVVRAVDEDGREDANTVEWFGVPNPVRFVDPAGAGADGLTPATAFTSIGQAVGATIALSGVNLYVRGASYSENVVLFPGMSAYGGFQAGFDLSTRDPAVALTELSTPLAVDLVVFQPGDLPVVLDGFLLSGNDTCLTGLVVEDVSFLVANCEVRDMRIHGVEVRSDLLEADSVAGVLRRLSVHDNAGEGIFIEAIAELVIDDCVVRDNVTEGIESQWLFATSGQTTRIELTRNLITGNGDEGVDLDLAEIGDVAPFPSAGARIRVIVRNNEIRGNGLAGLQVDLDFDNGDAIDARVRIEDNQFSDNRGEGIFIDGDARASVRLARNIVTGNALDGIAVSGLPEGPWFSILHSRILGNGGFGLSVDDFAGIDLRHCYLGANFAGSVRAPRAFIDASHCVFSRNAGGAPALGRVRYSIFDVDLIPTVAGDGNIAGPPGFVRTPAQFTRVVASAAADAASVANPLGFSVGDAIEFADDGQLHRIVAIDGPQLAFTPTRLGPVPAGTVVFGFGADDSVQESEGLLLGSPAIDGGDPDEFDRDATIADIGPIGGDTPGNVGIETGLGLEELPAELERLEPTPGLLATEARWTVRLRRPLWPTFPDAITVTSDGIGVATTIVPGPTPDSLTIEVPTATEGDRLRFELAPSFGPDALDRFTRRQVFDSRLAFEVIDSGPNDTIATAQALTLPASASGAIEAIGDIDLFRVDLSAGDRLRVEAIAGRRESPLVARVSLLSAAGAVLSQADAAPPLQVDPELPIFIAPGSGAFYVRIESLSPAGGPGYTYEIQATIE